MPTAQEYESSMIRTLAAYDPQLDTGLGTPVRKIISAVALELASYVLETTTDTTLYSLDSVSGDDLDRFVAMFGFARHQAIAAQGTVVIRRDDADRYANVDYGSQFTRPATANNQAMTYQTTNWYGFDEGVISIEVVVRCTETGSKGNAAANTVTVTNSYGSYTTCTNPLPISGGRDAETDAELRQRFLLTVFRNVAGTRDQYLGLSLAHKDVSRSSVIGQESRYSEVTAIRQHWVDMNDPGKFIPVTDENGKVVPLVDENGDPVYQKDENGDIIYETDENGDFVYDENGFKIPVPVPVPNYTIKDRYAVEDKDSDEDDPEQNMASYSYKTDVGGVREIEDYISYDNPHVLLEDRELLHSYYCDLDFDKLQHEVVRYLDPQFRFWVRYSDNDEYIPRATFYFSKANRLQFRTLLAEEMLATYQSGDLHHFGNKNVKEGSVSVRGEWNGDSGDEWSPDKGPLKPDGSGRYGQVIDYVENEHFFVDYDNGSMYMNPGTWDNVLDMWVGAVELYPAYDWYVTYSYSIVTPEDFVTVEFDYLSVLNRCGRRIVDQYPQYFEKTYGDDDDMTPAVYDPDMGVDEYLEYVRVADQPSGSYKTVDIYVDGQNAARVADIQYVDFRKRITDENCAKWLRRDGTHPEPGHLYVPLGYQPLIEAANNMNIGTSTVLSEDTDFRCLYWEGGNRGASRGVDAIELLGMFVNQNGEPYPIYDENGEEIDYGDKEKYPDWNPDWVRKWGFGRFVYKDSESDSEGISAGSFDCPDMTPFEIPYYYNDTIQAIQTLVDEQSVVTMDAMVHYCRKRYFGVYLTIMYTTFPREYVRSGIQQAIVEWANRLPFGATIQFSDIETVVANMAGVDNVRIAFEKDCGSEKCWFTDLNGEYCTYPEGHDRAGQRVGAFGIVECERDGITFRRQYGYDLDGPNDIPLYSDEVPEIMFVEVYSKVQSDW